MSSIAGADLGYGIMELRTITDMASTAVGNMELFFRKVVTDDAIENHGSSVIFCF